MDKRALEKENKVLKDTLSLCVNVILNHGLDRFAATAINLYNQFSCSNKDVAKRNFMKFITEQTQEVRNLEPQIFTLRREQQALEEEIKQLKIKKEKLQDVLWQLQNKLPFDLDTRFNKFASSINERLALQVQDLIELVNYSFQSLGIDIKEDVNVLNLVEQCKYKGQIKVTKNLEERGRLCEEAEQYLKEHYPTLLDINPTLDDLDKARKVQQCVTSYYEQLINKELKSTEKV